MGERVMGKIYIIDLGPVHMIPGQLIAPGELTNPGANFAPCTVTVRMSFRYPQATSRGGLPVVQHRFFSKVTVLHVNRTKKFPRGKSSLANAHY